MKKKTSLGSVLALLAFLLGASVTIWLGMSAVSVYHPISASQVTTTTVEQPESTSEPVTNSAQNEPVTEQKVDTSSLPKEPAKESPKVETKAPYEVSDHLYQRADGRYVYVIQAGDTLTSISHQVNVGIDELANLNQIRNMDCISEGAVLVLP
jgi:LysM repeat protein